MNIATRSPHLRPKAPRIVLAILCGVAVIALSQCKMIADKVTGVGVEATTQDHSEKSRDNRGNCVSKCAHKANDALDDEKEKHKKNLKKCNGNLACIDAENARHDAAVDRIQDNRKHCIDGCHHQGGGH